MKILVIATSSQLLNSSIFKAFMHSGEHQIVQLDNIENLSGLLKNDHYDFIVSEYIFDVIDIWRISNYINSDQMKSYACPLYLLTDTCDLDIPVTMAKECLINLISLDDFLNLLEKLSTNSDEAGIDFALNPQTKITLLIIEDDDDAAYFNYHALKGIYDVDLATDGECGYQKWLEKRHDLVLLDFMLPGMKGDKVLLKMMEVDKNQPVIVMTAFDHPDRNMDLILYGASDYVTKPVDIKKLKKLCNDVLKRASLFYQMDFIAKKQGLISRIIQDLEDALDDEDIDNARYLARKIKRHYSSFMVAESDH
ncbi:MAG: response regulator [Methyloglobulus sp.]|nr:response regulator [Methyloglobulus sp.]